jgi:cytoplasmic iron level regulating protein YaaA (DUF328/UPF0246 family)
VLILLPPSEGKTSPASGPRLAIRKLSFPTLTPVRNDVRDALVTLCQNKPQQAATVLGLGPKQVSEVVRNANLMTAPTAPAVEVYTGVLYDALDVHHMSARARTNLNTHVVLASALFGFVRPDDPIPAYRLSGDTTLPGLGPLASVWREPLTDVLRSTSGVILDLRSGAYAKLGPIPTEAADRTLVGRVLLERNGKRTVVSHHNKATKGRLVGALMHQRTVPTTQAALIRSLEKLGFRCEIHDSRKPGQPAGLDLIVREV